VSLSLCMVVKNEASFIRTALQSALPIVDEAIVVETGSTDTTPDIARALGAHVFEEEWPGDLGAAHNLPLEHARGDWILVLDGDERLDSASRRAIAELCERGRMDAYRFTFRNYQFLPGPDWRWCDATDPFARGALGWIPSRAVRLFRNDPRYRHAGQVHQRVDGSITAAGGRIGRCEVPIHHYGMLRCDRDKSQFYVALTRRQVEAAGDALSWLELGVALTHTDDHADTRRAFARARDLGLPAEGSFHLGRLEAKRGGASRAVEHLRHALSTLAGKEGVGIHRADILEELGRALESTGEPADAEEAYRNALELRADSPGALTDLAGLLIATGRLGEARGLVDRLLRRARGLEGTWTTLGNLELTGGDPGAAVRAFRTALDINPWSVRARFNLAVASARAGRDREARRALAAARELSNGQALADHDPSLLGPRTRAARPRVGPSESRPVIVSITDHLHSGSGRVLADVVEALGGDYRHVVLVADPGAFSGMGLREELEKEGADVRSMAWGSDLGRQLREIRPSLVVFHWWGAVGAPSLGPDRVAGEPWICVGHAPRPMPDGHDAYVVLSDFHMQSQAHLTGDRVHRIPNCVDLARFPDPRDTRRNGPVTIAMLSRLDPEKFSRRLLHYLPPLADLGARLLIAGRGRRRWEIEPEIEAVGLSTEVQFLGPIPHRDVPAFLSEADIGLHLTETADETMPKAILEMLAAGLPVVSQPRGSLPELVQSGANGFLSESEEEIAEHLETLIGSAELRRRMGARSRKLAEGYDATASSRRWRRLVVSLTEDGPRDGRPDVDAPALGAPAR
jgi:glycosyltransferase involved in cell wall biosynthesis/Flp pilus assembly protein TadD